MKKVLAVIGGIVLGVAAIVGTVYAVLYFQKKQKEKEEDCYIDGECGCGCCDDDYEEYLDDVTEEDEESEQASEGAEDTAEESVDNE